MHAYGYAALAALILVALVIVFTSPNRKRVRRWKQEDKDQDSDWKHLQQRLQALRENGKDLATPHGLDPEVDEVRALAEAFKGKGQHVIDETNDYLRSS